MKGILVLAHGSRARETETTLERLVEIVRGRFPDRPVQPAYMEFGEPDVENGLAGLVEQGCGDIAVAPCFLFDGIHIQEDIPAQIRRFTDAHPGVKVTLGKTLGGDPRIADILADCIQESV